ncbi:MAG: hypothetical protein HOO00_08965, partial [Rhodospirillaceae bacterium]|nr:hypothetical protein [Rhodospirillaceae bacterium]
MPACSLLKTREIRFGRIAAIMIATLLGVSACALPDFESTGGEENLWRSENYFIRIAPQDKVRGKAPKSNQQPVNIARDRIRGALKLVFIKATPKADAVPLFSDYGMDILGRYLQEGLAKAGPAQDVTFAISTTRKIMFGLEEQKVVTGRVFFVDNQLNIIFGSLDRDAPMFGGDAELAQKEKAELRLNPYVPGLRSLSLRQKATLTTKKNSGVFRPAGSTRPDWLVFSAQALTPRSAVAAPANKNSPSGSNSDYQQLRGELEKLKQELRRQQGQPAGRAPAPQPLPQAQPLPPGTTESMVQRLGVL